MNRRAFFQSPPLAQTAGHFLGALDELSTLLSNPPAPLSKNQTADEISLLRVARRAMATTFEVLLPFGTPRGLDAAEAALDEIDRLEEQLTVYRDHSEMSRLNRLASFTAVPVEERLFELLALAQRLTRETEGAFDITAGPLIKAWGFFRRCQRMPSEEERAAALGKVDMGNVALDPTARTVRYLRPGLEINLGSIGKGYALDRVAQLLQTQWSISAALLHGGHSSIYAIGSEPGTSDGWAVGISHPWRPEERLTMVRLKDQALGTSAATFQHLEWAGRKLGHIIDPRTGWPAEELASASVMAPTAAEADALATAFFILGAEKAKAYCEKHPDISAVLLPQGEDAHPISINLNN